MNTTIPTALAEHSYTIYTDGACHGNPGPGAWAYLIDNPDGTRTEAAGFLPDITNNRAELLAAIHALEMIPPSSSVTLFADSTYVTKGASEWLEGWKAKGWKNANKKPVKNRDLWETLDALKATRTVTFTHIPGHAGIPGNERVDELATDATTMCTDFAPITFQPDH